MSREITPWVVVILLMVLVLLPPICSPPAPSAPDTVYVRGRSDTVLVRDTVRMVVEGPSLRRVDPPAGRRLPGHVYQDSVLRLVVYADTVEAVEVEALRDQLLVRRVDTVTIREPPDLRRRWYAGAGVSAWQGPSLVLATGKGRWLYGLQYSPITQGVGITVTYKIR